MEVVVDSSVWINWIKRRDTPGSRLLDRLVRQQAHVGAADVVCAELLVSSDEPMRERVVQDLVDSDSVLDLDGIDDMRTAAACMRASIEAGRKVRSMSDCLIAAVCIREGVPLLHEDRDFTTLAELTDLQVVPLE